MEQPPNAAARVAAPAGYELTRDRIEIVIGDETQGRRWELLHVLRPLTDDEWLDYHRKATAVKVEAGEVIAADPKAAQLALWDLVIQRVDDKYLYQGEPVMTRPDWKTRIPISHKFLVAQVLLGQRAQAVDGPLA